MRTSLDRFDDVIIQSTRENAKREFSSDTTHIIIHFINIIDFHTYDLSISNNYRPENKEIPLETRYYLIKTHTAKALIHTLRRVYFFKYIDPTFMFSIISTFILSIITFIFIDFHIHHSYFLFIDHYSYS